MENSILKKRIMAFIIDSVFSTIISIIFSGIQHSFLLPFIIFGLYFIILDISPLQGSLGDYIMQLKKVSESGAKISINQAIKRHVGRLISIFTFNYVNNFSLKKDIFFHDKFSQTKVVLR
jgi:uncharacterized RDD family membrane protein YckC